MAQLRGFRSSRESVIREALTEAIRYIDSDEIDLAKATLLAIIELYGNKILSSEKKTETQNDS